MTYKHNRTSASSSPKSLPFRQMLGAIWTGLQRRRLAVGIAALVLLLGLGWAQFRSTKSIIFVDGKPVVCLRSENEAKAVLQQVKSSSGCNPVEVEFRQNVVVARATHNEEPVSRHRALTMIRTAVSPVVCRWSIIVNGKPAVAVRDRKTAGEVLDLAKLKFGQLAKNLAEEPQFKESIKVDEAAVTPCIYRSTAQGALDLLFAKPEVVSRNAVYVVKKGDVAGAIALRHGLTVDELAAMNPGRHLEHLQIEDKILIKAAQTVPPKLTVIVRDMNSRVEAAPPPVRRVSSARLYSGQTSLVSEGTWGKRKVQVADVYENGRRVGSEVMDEEILETPSPKIIAVGIKPRPTWN